MCDGARSEWERIMQGTLRAYAALGRPQTQAETQMQAQAQLHSPVIGRQAGRSPPIRPPNETFAHEPRSPGLCARQLLPGSRLLRRTVWVRARVICPVATPGRVAYLSH